MAWKVACPASALIDDTPLAVDVDGTAVAVVPHAGSLYAIHDECSHGRVALSEGEVEDGTIECFAHGSRFDLRTGAPLDLPATRPVPVYPVTISGDDVLIDLDRPIQSQEF